MLGKIWGRGRVYKPVEEVDLSDGSKEAYIRSDVFAPRATGLFLKIFVWTLHSKIFGPIVMWIMKAENLIYQLFTKACITEPPMYFPKYPVEGFEEQQVLSIDSGLSPRQQASQVLNCLPHNSLPQPTKDEPFFRRWTIREFSRAYTTGEVTPTEVAERFLSAVERSSNQSPGMCIFISYDSEDIRRQAAGSTLRYKKGTYMIATYIAYAYPWFVFD